MFLILGFLGLGLGGSELLSSGFLRFRGSGLRFVGFSGSGLKVSGLKVSELKVSGCLSSWGEV